MKEEKKWWQDIPKNGLLCVLPNVHENEDGVMAVTPKMVERLNPSELELQKIRPLTSGEWWQFAPWQDMKAAPMSEKIMILVDCHPFPKEIIIQSIENKTPLCYLGWLPLPEESQ